MTNAMPPSLWAATSQPLQAFPPLAGSVRTRVAVVGAGYTGLSAALHLGLAGSDAVVIDAGEPGWGASGRNGGQVIPGLKDGPDELERLFGPDRGPRMVRTVAAAADLVFDLIARFDIGCAPVRSGWIVGAHSEAAMARIAVRAREWQARGVQAQLLDAGGIAALTGSRSYVGGWLDPRGGTVQPLSYARGLAKAAASQGARIFGETPALSLERKSGGWRLVTPAGDIDAETVILAMNAYTGRLWPKLKQTVVPVFSLQVATRPLSETEAAILPGGQAVSDTKNLLRYFRRSPDGRLVLGTRGPFTDRPGQRHGRRVGEVIAEIYPGLADVPLDYVWSGRVAMTKDHRPHLHELAPGVYAALGYNGRGVAMATMLGKLLAERVSGRPWEEIDFPNSALTPIRFHALSRLGVMAHVQYYRLLDRFGRG